MAEDALSGKKVILKTTDKTHISALKNEYIRLHRLNHCGLPRVFDFHYVGQGAILSMEYCAGESLREIISNKAVDVSKALSIWNNITDILSYIHSQHLVHGDLKPDNIILNKNDIKLLDLGMARRNNSRINNLFIGTAAYAAPEILSGKGDVSQAADIYSLGILVYEMLVGDIPKAEQRLNRDAPWFVSVQKALSGPAAEILMKMLRYSPQERFSSAGALKSAMSETGLFPELSDRRQFEYVSFQAELLEIRNRNIPSKPLMLNGPVGIGKTRLLKELNFINQLNGHYSYYIDGSKPSLLEKTIEFMEPKAYILLDNASENSAGFI